MDSDLTEKIKSRAYQLWLEAGEPFDREQEFWLQAEREFSKNHDQGISQDEKAQEQPKDKERAQGRRQS